MHDPDQGIEDLRIGQGNQFVYELTDRIERLLAHALYSKPIDYAIYLVERHQLSTFDAQLHRRSARRFDANDPDLRVQTLESHRNPRDQPTASNWNHDYISLGKVFVYLQAKRSLAGDQMRIVKRMNVSQATFFAKLFCFLVSLIPDHSVQNHFRAICASRFNLRRRSVLGHYYNSAHSIELCRECDALRVIAGR